MSDVAVYASVLCMFLAGRPSIITCTRFLGNGPARLQGSWWCALRVRAYVLGLSTEGSWVNGSTSWRHLLVQLASQSFLVCPSGPVGQVALQTRFVVSSPSSPPNG